MKLAIWILAIVGLTPVVFLAAMHLFVFSASALMRGPYEQGTSSSVIVGEIYAGVGSSRLQLSTKWWPGLLVLLGLSVAVVGLWKLIPGQTAQVPLANASDLEVHMQELLASPNENDSLIVTAFDEKSMLIGKSGDQLQIESMSYRSEAEQQSRLATFLLARGLQTAFSPEEFDESSDFGMRTLTCPIGNTPAEAAKHCRAIFSEFYHVDPETKLTIDGGLLR